MAHPARRDSYGAPLPELAVSEREVLLHTEQNQAQLRLLYTLLDDVVRQMLRRGVTADVAVRFFVLDGTIQDDVKVVVERSWRRPRD